MLPGAVEAIGKSRCARKEAKNDVCNWRDWARTFIFFSFEGPVGYQRIFMARHNQQRSLLKKAARSWEALMR